MTYWDLLKQSAWSFFLYPIWPIMERVFNFLHKRVRQPFHLGYLAPGKTIEDLKNRLSKEHGFGNHFVAWTDPEQVLSWRKLESFKYQYHIRVFSDGEIRGHHELTPEAAPLRHLIALGEQPRSEDFSRFLGDVMTKAPHISKVKHEKIFEQIAFLPRRFPKMVIYKLPQRILAVEKSRVA